MSLSLDCAPDTHWVNQRDVLPALSVTEEEHSGVRRKPRVHLDHLVVHAIMHRCLSFLRVSLSENHCSYCYQHWGSWNPQERNQQETSEKFPDRFY